MFNKLCLHFPLENTSILPCSLEVGLWGSDGGSMGWAEENIAGIPVPNALSIVAKLVKQSW